MVKIRLTYVKNSDEEKKVLKVLKEQFEIISISREYEGRGTSKYCNLYIHVEVGDEDDL